MREYKFLKFQMWWLEALGLWSNKPRNFIKWFRTFTIVSLQIVNMFSGLTNLIKCNERLDCYLENATYTVLTMTAVYSFFIYLAKENLYKAAAIKLHEIVDQFDTYAYTNPAEKFSRKFAIGFTVYYMMGLLEYGVCPILDYDSCLKRDNTDSALSCGLPTPGAFPFDSLKSPGYEVAFVFQWVCATLCIKSMAHPVMLCLCMTYHVIAQLKMLQDNLQQICSNRVEKRCDLVRHCVKHHIAVLDFSDQIAAALNELMLLHAVLMALILTVNGFQIIRMLLTTLYIWNLSRYLIILFGFFVILSVMSTVGQTLIDQSMEVAESAYSMPWYDESLEFQRMVRFIILRAHKPLVLRSASISELSFPSFSKVMSSAYSYLTLLYNTILEVEDNN